MLVTGYCLDLDPTVSSKPKWFGTRSPNSINALDSIFVQGLAGLMEFKNQELMLK